MAITIQASTTLDVVSKQRELVEEALGVDSPYIRLKETLLDIIDVSSPDKAKIVADTLASMAVSLTGEAIQNALKWESTEKELALKKLEMEYQLDILAQQADLTENQIETSLADRQLKQAQLIRLYGTPTVNSDGDVIGLADKGKEYSTIKNIEEDTAGKAQAKAKVADDMLTSAKNREVLDTQKALYQRQTEGFDDNKYQKLFDTQMNAWGLMFSSGMLTTKPDIIRDDTVSTLYNQLTDSL